MADLKKARLAFMEMVEDLDPNVECVIPPKAAQGNFSIELSRGDEKQVVKITEKDFLALELDEDVRQKVEERVMASIEKLPEAFEQEEEEEEDDFDEEDLEDDEDDDAEEEEEEEEEDDAE
jgi:hypothetical protein